MKKNIPAKKSLGQNFLKDEGVLNQIIEAGELQSSDHVLEIGPGKAALTRKLLEAGVKITAIEKDDRLVPLLHEEFSKNPRFTLIHGDALTETPPSGNYKIIANIPYYITSPLLNHYLREQFENEGTPPTLLVLMVQKEVAEKIIAKDGRHSMLSLQVHLFGEPELVCIVPKTAFDPMPKVDSAVIKIHVHAKPKITETPSSQPLPLKKIFWLWSISFAQKRKKLSNNLAAALRKKPAEIKVLLTEAGIHENARAEKLSLEEWKNLHQVLNENL